MEYKLPKKFKDEWVSALRSGRYPQTDGVLHSDCGYCAIGVGLASAGKVKDINLFNETQVTGDMIEIYDLPFLDEEDPMLEWIIELNDNESYGFNEIAEWIEYNVKGV